MSTKIECTCCSEPIPYDSTVMRIKVITYQWTNEGFDRIQLVDALGNPVYEDNYFLNDDTVRPAYDEDSEEIVEVGDLCWDTVEAAMVDELCDTPPVETTDDPIKCYFCDSAVMLGEPCGWAQLNKVKASRRRPTVNGAALAPYTLEPIDDGYTICLPCLRIINDNIVTMWCKGVSYDNECDECTARRCWLHSCTCGCHSAK